jgi:hypothetical protein
MNWIRRDERKQHCMGVGLPRQSASYYNARRRVGLVDSERDKKNKERAVTVVERSVFI